MMQFLIGTESKIFKDLAALELETLCLCQALSHQIRGSLKTLSDLASYKGKQTSKLSEIRRTKIQELFTGHK